MFMAYVTRATKLSFVHDQIEVKDVIIYIYGK